MEKKAKKTIPIDEEVKEEYGEPESDDEDYGEIDDDY